MSAHTDRQVLIQAPLDLVWDLTNAVETWPDLFDEYESAEILRRDGNLTVFRLTTRPDEHERRWTWVSERVTDRDTLTINARRIEPGPFEYMRICWTYHQEENGVIMRWVQDFEMRPDAPLDDDAMAERIRTNSEVQMLRIKSIAETIARERATNREVDVTEATRMLCSPSAPADRAGTP